MTYGFLLRPNDRAMTGSAPVGKFKLAVDMIMVGRRWFGKFTAVKVAVIGVELPRWL